MLRQERFQAGAIHGDKEQRERDYVLNDFKSGRLQVIVATDVASRGLDVKDIGMVVNYDFPTQIEDYIHRIGRTGRAGATGSSYTFVTGKNAHYGKDLIKILEDAGQTVPEELRSLAQNARSYGGGGRGGRGGKGGKGKGGGRRW
jgi:ATP-dependent RNA helicase DDX5/DBP2